MPETQTAQRPVDLSELLSTLTSRSVQLLCGAATDTERASLQISGVHPADSTAAVRSSLAGSVVVVANSWIPQVTGFRLDILLRHAVDADVTAVLFPEPIELSASSRLIAERAGLAVLCVERQSAWTLLIELDRLLRGREGETHARTRLATERVAAIIEAGGEPAEVVETLSSAIGTRVRFLDRVDEAAGYPHAVRVDSPRPGVLVADDLVPGTEIALSFAAAQLARLLWRRTEAALAPLRLRSNLLLALIHADRSRVAELERSATSSGLPVSRSHLGARITAYSPGSHHGGRATDVQRIAAVIELELLESSDTETWNMATMPGQIILVRSEPYGTPEMYRDARTRVERIVRDHSDGTVSLSAGLGTIQPGADGLRQSVGEARIAIDSASDGGAVGRVVDTDRAGLRRMLADLGSSPYSAAVLHGILRSFDALSADRAKIAVETLNAYLDAQGSAKRAAAKLHLHPNAVVYRIKWILESIDLDLDDPDQRLAVHIACRTRLMDFFR